MMNVNGKMKLAPTETVEAVVSAVTRTSSPKQCEPLLFLIICDDEQYPTRKYSILQYKDGAVIPSTWEEYTNKTFPPSSLAEAEACKELYKEYLSNGGVSGCYQNEEKTIGNLPLTMVHLTLPRCY